MKIAALYVATDGAYFGLEDVEAWDEVRDARLYSGPFPVVAHPPCERWGKFWSGGPFWIGQGREPKKKGDDGGCFAAALAAVRKFGGVLEHPDSSQAWKVFGIPKPPRNGGWIADGLGGWTCCVAQGKYGHRAEKLTWLYLFGVECPPPLRWGRCRDGRRVDPIGPRGVRKSADEGICAWMTKRERSHTPDEFRDLLLSLARMAVVVHDEGRTPSLFG